MSSRTSRRTHPIRLKGPWEVTFFPADQSTTASVDQRIIHLPAEWRDLFGDTPGRAVFERRFNRPTGLTDGHNVRLLLRDVAGELCVRLNDERLPIERTADSITAVEITGRMEPHNRLRVEIEFDPCEDPECPGGLWQPVILQIEEPNEVSR